MPELKFVPDEFLESIELNRFKKFLTTNISYADLLNNSQKFGIIKNSKIDPSFSNFKIIPGTTSGTIKILNGFAYTKERNLITFKEQDNIAVPLDGVKYFIRVAYDTTANEEGTVSISTSGYLSGVGTEFTKLLRGQPNFPSLIEFVDSTNNLLQYEVLRVLDDTNAQLQGVFTNAESNLKYKVVGTFTPGIYPSVDSQFIFKYDSCIVSLLSQSFVPANLYYPQLIEDQQFIIGVVSNTGGVVTIQDSRYDFLWKTKAESVLEQIPVFDNAGYKTVKSNPLIAVTSIKKLMVKSVSYYQVSFDWKFKIVTKTIDRTNRTIDITVGSGGKFETVADFIDGSFDGWRLYHDHSGEYSTILSSSLVSSTFIRISLDYIPQAIGTLATELNDSLTYICPDSEGIEISVDIPLNDVATLPLITKTKLFSITTPNPQMLISEQELYATSFVILPVTYQYKNFLKQTNY